MRAFAAVGLAFATLAGCGAPPSVATPTGPAASTAARSLNPAAYVIETMKPSFSLNLPEGFTLQQLAADQFLISRGPDASGSGLGIVRLAAGGLIERLERAPEFAQKARVEIRLGDMLGHSIAMDAAPGQAQPPLLLESAELHTRFTLPLGARVRVIEFTVGASAVAAYYYAPAAEFGTYEPFIQGVLTSLAFRA